MHGLWFYAVFLLLKIGVLQIIESSARKSTRDQIGFSRRLCNFCDMGTQATCSTRQKHISGGMCIGNTVLSMLLSSTLSVLCFLSNILCRKSLHEIESTYWLPMLTHLSSYLMQKSDSSWRRSSTFHVTASYIQPLLLWAGAIYICRLVIERIERKKTWFSIILSGIQSLTEYWIQWFFLQNLVR